MKQRLVRVVLGLYPVAWRERYGAELEQLINDAAARDRSALGAARLIVDVARGGLGQRLGRHRRAFRRALLITLCAGIVFPIGAASLNTATSAGVPGTADALKATAVLAPSTRLAPGVLVFHDPVNIAPLVRSAQPRAVEIEVISHTDRVVAIDGPPAAIVLNPKTQQLVSVRPIRAR